MKATDPEITTSPAQPALFDPVKPGPIETVVISGNHNEWGYRDQSIG